MTSSIVMAPSSIPEETSFNASPKTPAKPFDFASVFGDPKFNALDFHDLESLDKEQRKAVAACMDDLLFAFLKQIQHRYQAPSRDPELRQRLLAWAKESLEPSIDCPWPRIEHALSASADLADTCYPLACFETRMHIATVTAAGIVSESGTRTNSNRHLARFGFDYYLGPVNSKWQGAYRAVIGDFAAYYGEKDPRVGSYGACDLMRHPEVTFTEDSFATTLPPHMAYTPPDAAGQVYCPENFPLFLRYITGAPSPFVVPIFKPSREDEVPYEYWMTCVPYLSTFICLGNDMFSWVKEVLAKEPINYITLQTQAKRQTRTPSRFATKADNGLWTFRDTLCETFNMVYESTLGLDRALVHFAKACPEPHRSNWKVDVAMKNWVAFKHGYMSFHVDHPRYMLNKLQDMVHNT